MLFTIYEITHMEFYCLFTACDTDYEHSIYSRNILLDIEFWGSTLLRYGHDIYACLCPLPLATVTFMIGP